MGRLSKKLVSYIFLFGGIAFIIALIALLYSSPPRSKGNETDEQLTVQEQTITPSTSPTSIPIPNRVASPTQVDQPTSIPTEWQGNCGGVQEVFSIPQGPEGFNRAYGFVLYNFSNSPLPPAEMRSLYVDNEFVWLGFASKENSLGILSKTLLDSPIQPNQRAWESCRGPEGRNIGPIVNAITSDNNGHIWVATDSMAGEGILGTGIWELSAKQWFQYLRDQKSDIIGYPDEANYTVLPFGEKILIGTGGGLVEHYGTDWYPRRDQVKGYSVVALAADPDGPIWAGTLDRGIFLIPPGHDKPITEITTENGLSSNNIRDIFIAADGDIWIATWGGGISVKTGNEWIYHRESPNSLPSNNVNFITEDPIGRIWVGTENGVAYLSGDEWEIYSPLNTFEIGFGKTAPDDCPPEAVDLWTATSQGLTHSRLPSESGGITNVQITGIPDDLSPGDEFSPLVTVTLENGITLSEGDSLQALNDNSFTSTSKIAVEKGVRKSGAYTFTFDSDPMIAPNGLGEYQTKWRVWHCTRYIGQDISINFTVGDSSTVPVQNAPSSQPLSEAELLGPSKNNGGFDQGLNGWNQPDGAFELNYDKPFSGAASVRGTSAEEARIYKDILIDPYM